MIRDACKVFSTNNLKYSYQYNMLFYAPLLTILKYKIRVVSPDIKSGFDIVLFNNISVRSYFLYRNFVKQYGIFFNNTIKYIRVVR